MNLNKEYYGAKEISKIIGCCISKSYDLIEKLNNNLSEEYPNKIIINCKIPIWYFNEKIRKEERCEKN